MEQNRTEMIELVHSLHENYHDGTTSTTDTIATYHQHDDTTNCSTEIGSPRHLKE
jgi:hypothetical protein